MLVYAAIVVSILAVCLFVSHKKEINHFLSIPHNMLRSYYIFLDNRKFKNKYLVSPFLVIYFKVRGWPLTL